jgi:hypothetical protein
MAEVLNGKPKTIATTSEEGGFWSRFVSGKHTDDNVVHAIMFEDGGVWDAYNGWRDKKSCPHCLGLGHIYD